MEFFLLRIVKTPETIAAGGTRLIDKFETLLGLEPATFPLVT
jgi:hypothetical protein